MKRAQRRITQRNLPTHHIPHPAMPAAVQVTPKSHASYSVIENTTVPRPEITEYCTTCLSKRFQGPAGPQNRRPVQEDIQALAPIPKPASERKLNCRTHSFNLCFVWPAYIGVGCRAARRRRPAAVTHKKGGRGGHFSRAIGPAKCLRCVQHLLPLGLRCCCITRVKRQQHTACVCFVRLRRANAPTQKYTTSLHAHLNVRVECMRTARGCKHVRSAIPARTVDSNVLRLSQLCRRVRQYEWAISAGMPRKAGAGGPGQSRCLDAPLLRDRGLTPQMQGQRHCSVALYHRRTPHPHHCSARSEAQRLQLCSCRLWGRDAQHIAAREDRGWSEREGARQPQNNKARVAFTPKNGCSDTKDQQP